MKKLVLVIALLGSGVNLLAYGENPVKNEVVVENNLATAEDPNDPILAYVVIDTQFLNPFLYFHTYECAEIYVQQNYLTADHDGRAIVESDQAYICLENSSAEETS